MKLQNIISLSLLLLLFGCREKQKAINPETKQLTVAVYASGNLVPQNEYKVMASIEGYLKEAFVKEGDKVSKGQRLFVIHSATQEANLSTAIRMASRTDALTGASSPLIKSLYSNLASADLKVKNDSLHYMRYKNLFEQEAIARSSFEKWQQVYLTSQQERNAILEQIKAQQLSLNIQKQGAVNGVTLSLTEKINGHLKSFTDGTVYEVYKQTGDHVAPHAPIALIGSGKVIARLSVDEDDFGKVKEGQKVVVKTDAFPDRILQARIIKVYPLLNKADQTFRVDAELVDELPESLYGLNIEANIVIDENRSVLAIPKEALLKGDSVLTKEKDGIRKVKISKGVEDRNWVEVKSGLTANNLIIIQ